MADVAEIGSYLSEMSKVTVYTTDNCGQCLVAKELLERHSITYSEVNLGRDPAGRRELTERTGKFTFPQIVADGKAIGGLSELSKLEQEGELKGLSG